MATQLDDDSGAECSLPDEKADDKKPNKNRGRGQSSEVGNDNNNKRPCLADVVKWVGDIPFVQSGRTGKVHCGTTIINFRRR